MSYMNILSREVIELHVELQSLMIDEALLPWVSLNDDRLYQNFQRLYPQYGYIPIASNSSNDEYLCWEQPYDGTIVRMDFMDYAKSEEFMTREVFRDLDKLVKDLWDESFIWKLGL